MLGSEAPWLGFACEITGSPSVFTQLAAEIVPGNVLEMQIIRPHPDLLIQKLIQLALQGLLITLEIKTTVLD